MGTLTMMMFLSEEVSHGHINLSREVKPAANQSGFLFPHVWFCQSLGPSGPWATVGRPTEVSAMQGMAPDLWVCVGFLPPEFPESSLEH